jgi:4-amino-4-deoxy-L-arabinose transferase-like glycosyltransferase
VTRRAAYTAVVAAAVVPRALALLHERADILATGVEKSDVLARVFVRSGTLGYVPGVPSASTQPLYSWFLIPIYWIAGRHWWSLGTAQIVVAAATALVVYEIGRRYLSPRAGLIAALVSTLHPYLVWHDIHVNREILDQLLGAAMFLLALAAGRAGTVRATAALGLVTGLAILSNSRLALLPVAFAAYLLWRRVGWRPVGVMVVVAGLTLVPWVVRNKVQVGCFTITTDARALWKANNLHTYDILARGGWIDAVPELPTNPDTPAMARDTYLNSGRKVDVHECAQQAYYEHLVWQFWKNHPGEKGRLMVQATGLLWNPAVRGDAGPGGETGALRHLRHLAEPIFAIALYLLAVIGLFLVAPSFRVLALIFFGYETVAAWVFAGTTRYRVPWDFVLALLAAAALTRLPLRRPFSQ